MSVWRWRLRSVSMEIRGVLVSLAKQAGACDFDGIDTMPKGINGVQDISKLYNELLKHNYSEELVRDIFWNNIYSIIGRVL